MTDAYIFDAIRTPRGKGREGGALNKCPPVFLTATLINAMISRNQVDEKNIGDLILGCVTQVGEQGGNVAKVAALSSGLSASTPGITLNRYCTSGLDACNFAAMKIMANVDDLVLAGGVEAMSRVPMLSDRASFYTDERVMREAKFVPMGIAADLIASLFQISREECDRYAVESQRRAAQAQSSGAFRNSLIPVVVDEKESVVTIDETIRGNTSETDLATLNPLYSDFGKQNYESMLMSYFNDLSNMRYVHHIGNSPGIVDGAALALIGSKASGEINGLKPRAKIVAMSNVASDPMLALTGGIDAAAAVLTKAGMTKDDIDLVEFNEAFAATSIKFLRDGGWSADQLNVNGGAISMGHAMGATGASLLGIILDELESRQLSTGLISVSGAAGVGTAMVVERV